MRKRTFIVGALLFVGFAVAFAPAGLVRTLLPRDAGVQFLEPTGTVWRGTAALLVAGQSAGTISWTFSPASLLQGALGFNTALAGPEHALTGHVRLGIGSVAAAVDGRASATFVNRWLAPYDIAISGDLVLNQVQVRVPYPMDLSGAGASGTVRWAGGPVRYRLAQQTYTGQLPPLVAHLGETLQAAVYPEGGQTPLLHLEVLDTGFVRIGVTKLLTQLIGNPWPGSHADHEVVLEVEEQLF